MKLYKNKNGFTLVEVMVIITIIGILASLTIYGIGSWRKKASETEVKNALVSLSNIMENERNFNNGYPTSLPSSYRYNTTSLTVTYKSGGDVTRYCADGISNNDSSVVYMIKSPSKEPQAGTCPSF